MKKWQLLVLALLGGVALYLYQTRRTKPTKPTLPTKQTLPTKPTISDPRPPSTEPEPVASN